jgi:L-malate glycosyltransferase
MYLHPQRIEWLSKGLDAMRVMLLAPSDNIHSRRFLQWLRRAGCEVVLLDSSEQPGFALEEVSYLRYPRGASRHGRLPVFHWLRWMQLRRDWVHIRPDIVHVHWVDHRAYECYRARLHPLVLTCWGSDINQHFEPGSDPRYARRTGQALARADHVFADSHQVLERCQTLARCPVSSSLLFMGVNLALFRPGYMNEARAWRQALGIPEGARVILSVRTWGRFYRHDMILEAFARARAHCADETVLILKRFRVEDDALGSEMEQLAIRLGVANAVRWVDNVPYERMPVLYAMSDLVVSFPPIDAFPVSFFEAAACSKRVISSALPAYDGFGLDHFWWMVPPDNLQELVEAMVQGLAEPPDGTLRRSEQARKWAEKYGDEAQHIERIMSIYGSLLHRSE